jgi:hypothetical protein
MCKIRLSFGQTVSFYLEKYMETTQPLTDSYFTSDQTQINEFYKRMGINNERERSAIFNQRDMLETSEPPKRSCILHIVTTSKEV